MSEYRGEIDRLLAERRPDRYETDGGDEWLDTIADDIESLIPEDEARSRYARAEVRRREGQKTKSTNKLLRDIFASGQPPLDWMETLSLPIVAGKERVALRAATADDFLLFATDERRHAAGDFASRNETCVAAEWIADLMVSQGAMFYSELDFGDADAA